MSGRSGANPRLRAILTARETNGLSAAISRKLENYLEQREDVIKKLEHANAEGSTRRDSKKNKSDETENVLSNMERQLIESNCTVNELRNNLKAVKDDCEKIRRERNSAIDEKENLKVFNDKQTFEIARLNEEISDLSSQLKKAIAEKCEALSKSDEIQNRELSLESKEKRFESEKIHLNNQIQSLTEDLKKYTNDLHNIQSEHASVLSKLELELAEKSEQLQSANANVRDLNAFNEKLMEVNKNNSQKLLCQHDIENSIMKDYKRELEAKTKLIDLYLKTIDECNSRNEELNGGLVDIQKMANSLTEQTKELEIQNKKLKADYENVVDENNAVVNKLKEELEDAKTKLTASKEESLNFFLKDLSPFASSTCELIKSTSLTEVYRQLVHLSEELVEEKKETGKLKHKISILSEEIKDKSDTISKRTTDLDDISEQCGSLKRDLSVSQEKFNDMKNKYDNVLKEHNSYEKENKRLQREVQNLSRQICYFLEELEENVETENSSAPSDSGVSLPKEIIAFSNIKDLQSKNLQLLNLVDDLKREIEDLKSGQVSKEFRSIIDSLNDRINELTKTQNDQIKIIDALTVQRDRYEKLYKEISDKQNVSVDGNVSMSIEEDKTSTQNQETNSSPKDKSESQLLEIRKQLKEQSDKYKRYKDGMLAREKILTEQVDSLQKKLHDLNLTYAKCVSVSNTNNEKCKILECSVATYKKQITSLEERNKIYESSIVKQEETIKYLRDQLLESLTKLTSAENSTMTLSQELKFVKDSENRLKRERDLLKKERLSQSLILNDIEFLKVTESRKEEENLLNLESKLNTSIKECTEFQRKLKTAEEKIEMLNSQLQNQTKNSENRLNELNIIIEKNKTEISTLYDQLKSKSSNIEDLNKRLLSVLNRSDKDDNSDMTKKMKDLEKLLSDRQIQIDSLQQELLNSGHIIKDCNAKYATIEIELNKIESTHKSYKNDMEKKLETLQQSESQLKEKISKLEGELSSQSRDLNIMNNNELKVELVKSREDMKTLREELAGKSSNLEILNKEMLILKQNVLEAEEKYKKEVSLHSIDVSTLTQLKQQLLVLKAEINNLKSEKDHSDGSLEKLKSSWESREKELIKENEELQSRLGDLNSHNELLHEQIQELTSRNPNMTLTDSQVTDDEKSLEKLANVIKHLRRERDIFSTKYDIIQAEKSRMKSELDMINNQLNELRQILLDENKKSSSNTQMYTVNNEISKKLETLNVLTDSNVLLRQERVTLINNIKELTEKNNNNELLLTTLEKNNNNLQTSVNNLQTENNNLKTESGRWKARINSLLEKANKTRPEDWKRLQNERETLAKMLTAEKENTKKLTDEILTLKNHKIKVDDELNNVNNNYKKQSEELNTIKVDISKISQELMEAKESVREKTEELNKSKESLTNTESQLDEVSKREVNLRKIARKYKSLYEELKAETEGEKKTETAEGESNSENQNVEAAQKEKETNEKLSTQINALTEENEKLQNEIIALKAYQETEERLKQQLAEANVNISQLTETNTSLNNELMNVRSTIQILEKDKDENEIKYNNVKSHYDDRILALEKAKNISEQEKKSISTELNRKIEFLLHKIGQMQRNIDFNQSPKPSTSSYQGEQSSETPKNANTALASVPGAISSSASSSHIIEYLPSSSSSSHQMSQFHGSTLPPESTQDVGGSVEKNQTEIKQISHQTVSNVSQTASESRMEHSQAHQQASSSSNNSHSNSTVTTSHRIDDSDTDQRSRKRCRTSIDDGKGDNKRSKRLAELETEYQVPTSSQRDQEDDCVIIDSGDEETYQGNVDDDDKGGDDTEVTGENRRQIQNAEVERTASSAVSGGMETNEVELVESGRQDPQNSNRVHEGMSNSNEARADPDGTPSVPHSPNREQQIETISSVTEGNEGGNGYMSLGMVMSNVGSAGAVNLYDDGSDSIVPSTPVLYVPRRNDGFGEAVSSPLTVSGGSAPDGHFTFSENNPSANSGVMEDTHADLTSQIAPYLPAIPAENENIQTQESSEAEAGRSQGIVDEESPMVSSQGSLPTSPHQIEDSSEAEAGSTS